MRKLIEYKLAVLFLLVFSLATFAQSNEKIEQELLGHLKNIEKWSSYGEDSNDELLSKENELFEQKLVKYTKTAATLGYRFGALDEYMDIAASEDGNLRIFSWDTQDGGTMHNFSRVYQWRAANGKVYSKTDDLTEGDAGSYVYDIFTVDAGKGGKVYLVCSNAILSSAYRGQAVRAYKIAGGSLVDNVKIIKTAAGLTDSIGFEYDFFSISEGEKDPVKLFKFDKKTKTLKFPVVLAEDKEFPNGRVTGKFISYRFNGTYFVKVS